MLTRTSRLPGELSALPPWGCLILTDLEPLSSSICDVKENSFCQQKSTLSHKCHNRLARAGLAALARLTLFGLFAIAHRARTPLRCALARRRSRCSRGELPPPGKAKVAALRAHFLHCASRGRWGQAPYTPRRWRFARRLHDRGRGRGGAPAPLPLLGGVPGRLIVNVSP